MDEPINAIYTQIKLSSIGKIKACAVRGMLRIDPMEEDEDEAQPISANDEMINTILVMTHQNILAIQKLTNNVYIIKRDTCVKSIIKNDNNIYNYYLSHFCVSFSFEYV